MDLIYSRFSNHRIGDKRKFIDFQKYDSGLVKLVSEEVAPICSKGTISIDSKHKTYHVYFVKGLKYNLLSVGWICSKGYKLIFHGFKCEIKVPGRLIVEGTRTNGNVYYIKKNRGCSYILV